jgi:hypothetical protein
MFIYSSSGAGTDVEQGRISLKKAEQHNITGMAKLPSRCFCVNLQYSPKYRYVVVVDVKIVDENCSQIRAGFTLQ